MSAVWPVTGRQEAGQAPLLPRYEAVVGPHVLDQLRQLAAPLQGAKVVHVNSTRLGGGVAEILEKLVPCMAELGLEASWEVIDGTSDFFHVTKSMHNALQGHPVSIPDARTRLFEDVNRDNAERLGETLRDADYVFIHDPQPAPLISLVGEQRGRWVWRCHIDLSRPFRPVWSYLRPFVAQYDASIFSLPQFGQPLPHPVYIIPPSIDALSEKNIELGQEEIAATLERFGIDAARPVILQVSRFDRFKDPVGVIQAYRLAVSFVPDLQLVLAGGEATDDPEGESVLTEVREAAADDPDVHVLLLPADSGRTINALQRGSDIVLQKSLREGFGLTVTEGMWKGKPVIGGNTGGIRLQVVNHQTGFLVDTPEGAALRIRYLLLQERERLEMGERARELVREDFLITRHLRDYLTLMVALAGVGADGRIELW